MIIGYVGTPGSGKTYQAVKRIIENLMLGRVVYTNIEGLEKPECRESIRYFAGLSDHALERQLKIFEPGQIEEFWQHCEPKSMIVIDEAQNYFNSRDWQSEKNRMFGTWASTHRHHGYDVILITQRPERIDSSVRSLFQWLYLYRKQDYFGSLVTNKYLEYAYAGEEMVGKPLTSGSKKYDDRIFRCYKSYVADDIKEQSIQSHVNILKHPVFYAIPVVLCITIYMLFFKSSLGTGDILGTKKAMAKQEEIINKGAKKSAQNLGKMILIETGNGGYKISNRQKSWVQEASGSAAGQG